MPSPSSPHFAHWLLEFFSACFLSILFLQSGLDKVFDWTGNLSYQSGFFQKSPLRNAVPLLLGTLTAMEVLTGGLSAIGVLQLLIRGTAQFAFYGAALSGFTLLAIFFGQRMAKDYAAAAGFVPYFLASLAAVFITGRV